MKKSANFKIRLGAFVVIGLLIFIGGIYFLGKKQNLFNSTIKVRGMFHNVGGLQVGNNVRFSGINVGTVDLIKIVSDTMVMVECVIDQDVTPFIKRDAKVLIGSEGLMGNKVINILPGSSEFPPITNNDTLITIKPLDVDEIIKTVKSTAENAEIITNNLAYLTTNIRNGKGMVGKLFSDSTFSKRLDKTLVNINKGAAGFSNNMEAAQESFLLKPLFKKKKKKEREKENEEAEKKENETKEENKTPSDKSNEEKGEKN